MFIYWSSFYFIYLFLYIQFTCFALMWSPRTTWTIVLRRPFWREVKAQWSHPRLFLISQPAHPVRSGWVGSATHSFIAVGRVRVCARLLISNHWLIHSLAWLACEPFWCEDRFAVLFLSFIWQQRRSDSVQLSTDKRLGQVFSISILLCNLIWHFCSPHA